MSFKVTATKKNSYQRFMISKEFDARSQAETFIANFKGAFVNLEIKEFKSLSEAVTDILYDHDESDILSEIYEQLRHKKDYMMIDFNEAQIFNLNCEGYVVVKADTQKEQMVLTELLQTVITGHNDQQSKLFFNQN
jgi:hypothetical protein